MSGRIYFDTHIIICVIIQKSILLNSYNYTESLMGVQGQDGVFLQNVEKGNGIATQCC
jgi:hypothetical protein